MSPQRRFPIEKTKRVLSQTVIYLILSLLTLLALVPILAGFITAFKPQSVAVAAPPVWVFQPTIENFRVVLVERANARNLLNSVILSSSAVFISLLVGFPAAYALSRFRIRGSKGLLSWIISLRMIPPVVVALPFFIILRSVKMIDTYHGLILVYLSIGIPLVIWMMRGYLVSVPRDVEDSAMVDGCNRLQALWRVVLPMVKTGIIATGLLTLIFIWNDYLMALILTGGTTRTMPVAAAAYITRTNIRWGELFAAEMLIALPVIIIVVILRKHLVRGFTFGMIGGK
ncbi:MAG: carbohydrate ABC transporter permease [Actinobacteria bacterium]|nr:carbohydrate ABC transporter permease [Actinomycetota bacterium]